MKAHEFISRLDEARYGKRRAFEDKAPVAAAPSHAPTSTAQWKTDSQGKSEDHGEKSGGEGDAIKKSKSSIPAPIAKSPSHAPTSSSGYSTTGKGSSEDKGENVSKEAMKEAIDGLLDGDTSEFFSLLREGAHKPGCQCGFCKNKGRFGRKKEEDEGDDEGGEMQEDCGCDHPHAPGHGLPLKRRLGGEHRLGFRSRVPARPKATTMPANINPNQPAMERLDAAYATSEMIQEMADELLESPNRE